MPKKISQDELLERAKIAHGDRYDDSDFIYMTMKAEVDITCRKHGSFRVGARNHLRGNGCINCGHIPTAIHKIPCKRSDSLIHRH